MNIVRTLRNTFIPSSLYFVSTIVLWQSCACSKIFCSSTYLLWGTFAQIQGVASTLKYVLAFVKHVISWINRVIQADPTTGDNYIYHWWRILWFSRSLTLFQVPARLSVVFQPLFSPLWTGCVLNADLHDNLLHLQLQSLKQLCGMCINVLSKGVVIP